MKNGLHCSGGYNLVSVGSEGRVGTCHAFLYKAEGYLGNILTDDIKLRGENEWFRCPNQACLQICDRHWAKKRVYKDDAVVDEQDIVNPEICVGKRRFISILFAPSWQCNYSCKYCSLPASKTYPEIPGACTTRQVSEWIPGFDRFFKTNKIDGGVWHTDGGEPLYYDGIDILFRYFHEHGFKIALTTNASADIYEKIIRVVPPETFIIINCSLHPSDKSFRWEMFKNRVQLLKLMGYPVVVNLVGHPDQITLAPEYSAWCKSIGVQFSVIPLIGLYFDSIESYPDALKKIVYENSKIQDADRFVRGKRFISGEAI